MNRPRIVCLCGSLKFERELNEAAGEETAHGRIVVMPHRLSDRVDEPVDPAMTHCAKIDLADEVLVVCPGDYVGESTAQEIAYAEHLGKPIRYRRAAP